MPSASTLQANGGCLYVSNPTANTYTITPNGTDNLNGSNSAKTYPGNSLTLVTSDGTSNVYAPVLTNVTLTGGNTWSGMQTNCITTLSAVSNVFTPDGTCNNYKLTLGATNSVANPSVINVGASGLIEIDQDAIGSRTISSWGSQFIFQGGTGSIALSTAANARDWFSYFIPDSTHVLLAPGALNATH
jgi:hypothetical protein